MPPPDLCPQSATAAAARSLLDDPDVTAGQLFELVSCAGLSVRLRAEAAGHPVLTALDVLSIVQRSRPPADFVLACTTRMDVLDLMADDTRHTTRAIAAFNPATSAATLQRLASDPHHAVRVNAGLNGNLPTSTRTRLARHDPDPRVREEVLWAMTTAQGRAVLDGARYATLDTDPTDEESRVLAWGG